MISFCSFFRGKQLLSRALWHFSGVNFPFYSDQLSCNGGFDYGGLNACVFPIVLDIRLQLWYQVLKLPGHRGPINPDTLDWTTTNGSLRDGPELKLAFSDEFNNDGRTFYSGIDPRDRQTGSPKLHNRDAITIKDKALKISLSKKGTHDLIQQCRRDQASSPWPQYIPP